MTAQSHGLEHRLDDEDFLIQIQSRLYREVQNQWLKEVGNLTLKGRFPGFLDMIIFLEIFSRKCDNSFSNALLNAGTQPNARAEGSKQVTFSADAGFKGHKDDSLESNSSGYTVYNTYGNTFNRDNNNTINKSNNGQNQGDTKNV